MSIVDALSLIDLADARRYLGVASHDTDDEIARLCEAVTAAIERETSRKLVKRAYTNELYDGTGKQRQILREYPLTLADITKVEFRFAQWGSDWQEQDRTELVVDDDGRTLIYLDRSFPLGLRNIRLNYSAGLSPTPQDLRQAALVQLEWEYKSRDRVGAGITSQTFAGQTTAYFVGELLPEVKRKLGPHMRVGCGV